MQIVGFLIITFVSDLIAFHRSSISKEHCHKVFATFCPISLSALSDVTAAGCTVCWLIKNLLLQHLLYTYFEDVLFKDFRTYILKPCRK